MAKDKKRSLAMITAAEGAWRPPAPSTQSTPAEFKWKWSANREQKLRLLPNRSLPTEHVKARMPTEQYGACCKGTKKWGDGKGSRAFGDGITYVCHMCNYELLKPMWALSGCSTEQEFNEQMEQLEHGVLPSHDTRADRVCTHAPGAPHFTPPCCAQPAAQLTGRTVRRRRVACHQVSMWVLFKIRPSMRAALPRPARRCDAHHTSRCGGMQHVVSISE